MICGRNCGAGPLRARSGLTFVEALITLVLVGLIIGVLISFKSGAERGNRLAADHSEAIRSALTSLDAVQQDVERMLYQCPGRDLVMLDHPDLGPGSGLALRLPDPDSAGDVRAIRHRPVAWRLERHPAGGPGHVLVRRETDTGRETVLRGHRLADFKVRLIPRGTPTAPSLSPLCAFLELTVTGLPVQGGPARHCASVLVPLARLGPPEDFP